MEGRISYWNSSAESLYGWTREQAVGKVSHTLLRTKFPKPLDEIESELLQNKVWEGELVHTTRDGRQVQVKSRWSLELDEQSGPLVEINRLCGAFNISSVRPSTQQFGGAIFDYPSRVLWAIIIMLSVALLSNLVLLRDAAILRKGNLVGVDVKKYEERWQPVRLSFPPHGVVGYMSGPHPEVLNDEDSDDYDAVQQEYRLAQYVVAPVILRPATEHAVQGLSFIVVDEYEGGSVKPQRRAKIEPPKGFSLMRDFGNGLLLYHRERR
jgi:hypothetical protein